MNKSLAKFNSLVPGKGPTYLKRYVCLLKYMRLFSEHQALMG